MLQTMAVGYLGADAEKKKENGKEFTTFRVAHSERWTDEQGNKHEQTQWVDCIMAGHPNVADFLKKGTQVYVSGYTRLRCYSSEKARGFVAGITIAVVTIELLSAQSDAVPSRLYDVEGHMYEVVKYYHTDAVGQVLNNGRGREFAVDDNGWIVPYEKVPEEVKKDVESNSGKDNG